MSIAWLHVLNEHPTHRPKYSTLFGVAGRQRFVGLRSGLHQVRLWLNAKGKPQDVDPLPEKADILFISHLLNEGQIAGEDFYFGRQPEALQVQGRTNVVILTNNTARNSRGLGRRWQPPMAPRLVLGSALSLAKEFALRRRLSRESRRLRAEARETHDPLLKRVLNEASLQALSTQSIATLRLHDQILALMARLRPRAVVVTFEGHAWERLVFAAARQIDPRILCVGYHHTILFPQQHAALRPLPPPFNPDIILTAGEVTRERFRGAYQGQSVQVSTMGIHRRQGTTNLSQAQAVPTTCLVIPDGIYSEVVFLFDFAIEAARRAPWVHFLFRLHPIIAVDALRERYPRYRSLPPNVAFSDRSIAEDFARSHWAMYRASNAAIYAVIAGLRPFYVAKENEMNIDSLYQLVGWKKNLCTVEEFVHAAEADRTGDRAAIRREAAEAAKFCENYFMPHQAEVMAKALGYPTEKASP